MLPPLLEEIFTNRVPLFSSFVPTVDPEMRAEFEEQSKKNPMNSIMAGPQPGGNFDVAGFLAGQGSGSGSGSGNKEQPATTSGNGGKKAGKR